MKRRMTAIRGALAGSLCLAGISGLAGCQAAPAGNVNVPSAIQVTNVEDQVISVTAKEEVKVVPDMAELNSVCHQPGGGRGSLPGGQQPGGEPGGGGSEGPGN